jgi:glucose-1-phosphate cytidylyltransferase
LHSNLGQRLLRVRKYLEGEEMFLANYSDGLSDLKLDAYIDEFKRHNVIAGAVAVRPSQSLHAIRMDDDGMVSAIESVRDSDYWINGGFFCLRQGIFEHLREGEELVEEPFQRLIRKRQLWTHRHPGFWAAMDTFKDKITLDRMEARGDCPWMVWHTPRPGTTA